MNYNSLKYFLALIHLLAFLYSGSAQVRFQKTFGGINSDVATFIQSNSDGGYIIGGGTSSFGDGGIYLVKLDSVGNLLWTRTYGGTNSENVYQIGQSLDGGYILSGLTNSFGVGGTDVYVIKLNSNGDTVWTRTYGGVGNEGGNSIQQTDDGGYIILGGTNTYGAGNYDFYTIRTNPNGDTLWTKTYGRSNVESGFFIQKTSDGGFILIGGSDSFGAGDDDVYVIKISANGDMEWAKSYGGTNSDGGISIRENVFGGYTILAGTASFGSGGVYTIGIDDLGDTLWTKVYSDSVGLVSRAMASCSDQGYIITGSVAGSGANLWDVFLIRIDSAGDTLWTKQYDNDVWDEGYSVTQTSDGGFVVTGFTGGFTQSSRDMYVIKTDGNGNTGCGNEKSMDLTVGSTNTIVSSTNTVVGSGGVAGNTNTMVSTTNTVESVLCFDTITSVDIRVISHETQSLQVFPNPAQDMLYFDKLPDDEHVTLIIRNILGQLIYQTELAEPELNIFFLPSGLFLLTLVTDSGSFYKKLVKE